MKFIIIAVLILSMVLSAQTNTWSQLNNGGTTGVSGRQFGAMIFVPDSNRFLLTMGYGLGRSGWVKTERYSEIALTLPDARWLNFLPHDTLYGVSNNDNSVDSVNKKWADSTGFTYGQGNTGFYTYAVFGHTAGYLRPYILQTPNKAYFQYAYNNDDKCLYFYVYNKTSRYNTQTRLWDTLTVSGHPSAFQGGTANVHWGALCYDAYNKEIVAFGGANVDAVNGHYGTWTFNTVTKVWTRLNLPVEPPSRCNSQMVFDAKNNKIILFGGDHLDLLFSDTWVYDCLTKSWSEKRPALSPAPRGGHALLYLPKSQSVVLLGGYTYSGSSGSYSQIAPFEMWKYVDETSEWKLIKSFTTAGTFPVWSIQTMVAVDTGDRIIALSDSSYAKKSFVLTCDPTQTDESGTTLRGVVSGTIGKRGGAAEPEWFKQGVGAPNIDSLKTVYKNLPLNTWVKMTPPKVPSGGRYWSTKAIDTDHDQLLVWGGGHSGYCGLDIPQYSIGDNRWHIGYTPEFMLEFNGDPSNSGNAVNFFSLNNRPFMPGHPRHAYCYSSVHKKMVYYSHLKYTYFYDPVRMDWDTNHVVIPLPGVSSTQNWLINTPHGVFASLRTPGGDFLGVNKFYLLDATNTWKVLPVKGTPEYPIMYDLSSGLTYDSKRNRVIIFSMYSKLRTGADTARVFEYRFNDSTLAVLTTTGNYDRSDNRLREVAYLPAQDKVVLQGEPNLRLFNCATNTWEVLTVTKASGVGGTSGTEAGFMYDPKRDLLFNVMTNCEVYVMRIAGGYNPDSLMSVSIDIKVAEETDENLTLSPNPFNPSTVISFTMNKTDRAILTVYNIKGEIIAILANKVLTKGKQEFKFISSSFASGVYFVRLTTGSRTLQKQLIILK